MISYTEYRIFLMVTFFVSGYVYSADGQVCKTDDDCLKSMNNSFCATNQTCNCKPNFTVSKIFSICVETSRIDLVDKARKIGETCLVKYSVPSNRHSHCVDGIIKCKESYQPVSQNGSKICRQVCKTDDDCLKLKNDSFCATNQTCLCKPNFTLSKIYSICVESSLIDLLDKPRKIGETCLVKYSVPRKPHTRCVDGIIKCKGNYQPVSENGIKICRGSVKLGSSCRINSNCADILAHCSDERICSCLYDSEMINNTCFRKAVFIGSICGPRHIVTGENAECRNGTVICKFGYYSAQTYCVNEKGATLKEACFNNTDCTAITAGSRCHFQECRCRSIYATVKTINGKPSCVSKVNYIGVKCDHLDTVTITNAECRNGRVWCKRGYHSARNYCINDKGVAIGERCTENSDCTAKTVGSKCKFRECYCQSYSAKVKTIDGKPSCVQQVLVGGHCDGKYLNCSDSDASCEDGKCQCNTGYYGSFGKCSLDTSLISSSVKIGLYALGAIIFVVIILVYGIVHKVRSSRAKRRFQNSLPASTPPQRFPETPM